MLQVFTTAIGTSDDLALGGGLDLDALKVEFTPAVKTNVGVRGSLAPVVADDVLVSGVGRAQGDLLSMGMNAVGMKDVQNGNVGLAIEDQSTPINYYSRSTGLRKVATGEIPAGERQLCPDRLSFGNSKAAERVRRLKQSTPTADIKFGN